MSKDIIKNRQEILDSLNSKLNTLDDTQLNLINNYINNTEQSSSEINGQILKYAFAIVHSKLSDVQKQYFLLKLKEVLNSERRTASNCRDTEQDATIYWNELKKIGQMSNDYLEKIFEQLNDRQLITPSEKNDYVEHYIYGRSWEKSENDRPNLQKKIKRLFRGFSGVSTR